MDGDGSGVSIDFSFGDLKTETSLDERSERDFRASLDAISKPPLWEAVGPLGKAIEVDSTFAFHTWSVGRVVVTEKRHVEDHFRLYENERLPKQTIRSPDEVDPNAFTMFEDDPDVGIEHVEVEGSARVVKCHLCKRGKSPCEECDASGRVECEHCLGFGRTKCSSCDGSGREAGERSRRNCSQCRGKGDLSCRDCHRGTIKCPECDGKKKSECRECHGTMRLLQVLRATGERVFSADWSSSYDDEMQSLLDLVSVVRFGDRELEKSFGPMRSIVGLAGLSDDAVASTVTRDLFAVWPIDPNADPAYVVQIAGAEVLEGTANVETGGLEAMSDGDLGEIIEQRRASRPVQSDGVLVRDQIVVVVRTWFLVRYSLKNRMYRAWLGKALWMPVESPLRDRPDMLLRIAAVCVQKGKKETAEKALTAAFSGSPYLLPTPNKVLAMEGIIRSATKLSVFDRHSVWIALTHVLYPLCRLPTPATRYFSAAVEIGELMHDSHSRWFEFYEREGRKEDQLRKLQEEKEQQLRDRELARKDRAKKQENALRGCFSGAGMVAGVLLVPLGLFGLLMGHDGMGVLLFGGILCLVVSFAIAMSGD